MDSIDPCLPPAKNSSCWSQVSEAFTTALSRTEPRQLVEQDLRL
jgi:hypothetical protein